jgi:uncharacterized protein (UPF0276 family)
VRRGSEEEVNGVGARLSGGVGLGLRWEFVDELLARMDAAPGEQGSAQLDFLEVSPENYMGRGGYFRDALARAGARYPIVTHGLTMSMGGTGPLDTAYLEGLRAFIAEVASPWHSDHLCFGASDGRILHDLLPLTFTDRAVRRVADRIRRAQDVLGVPLAVENISFYLHPGKDEMTEAEFVARVCDAADCGLMLDVNNAYVNSVNFGFDVDAWMAAVPLERVVQMHVAGHDWFDDEDAGTGAAAASAETGRIIVDTHGADVCDPVLALLERVLAKTGPVPVLLERDQQIPAFDALLGEVAKIRAVYLRATARA